jgi:hypothetical protein
MAVDDRSIPPGLPQVVPAIDATEILQFIRESLRPLAPIAGPLITSAFGHRLAAQNGAARKDFLEGLVIALLAFSIGLAVGVALCLSRH